MNIIKVKDYEALSEKACEYLIDRIRAVEKTVLGLATGSTPEGLYKRLIEKYREGNVSFKDVTTFNLDEYVGLKKEDPNSYYYFMKDKLFNHIDVEMENVYLPKGVVADLEGECSEYERLIQTAGNIDVQILGLGLNGHIGFNEPGTAFSSRTHIVELDASTREANARFFDSIDEVPTQAITMGIETIMESKEIVLLVSGEKKAEAVKQLIEGEVSEDFPATVLRNHDKVTLIADEGALGKVGKSLLLK
ncbi:glucosamine-6-phosphate deaminase [Oceanobacillus bengalensis]|uniref:Glucosamine-6-phosphate deaminase n=1 Tax=Oceanobacillus bengalensis TaxID=1435466 RepID=A0A494YZT7_9BACI|nr:glucosamine-6-phosphate deaminase [Oceanobacillus bengalensis]RKQ15690.1 glucosamine-6-phosphate deaminase [Oceanobacillus bengalensis]